MSIVLVGSTSGSVTLQEPAVAGTTVLDLPAASGTVMVSGNMPAFSVYRGGSNQNITTQTNTKVQLNTEEFDTSNAFDSTTNYRFTPQVAGYYQITGQIEVDGTSVTRIFATIYKNGSAYKGGNDGVQTAAYRTVVNALVYLNGSTDYVELYGWAQGTNPNFYNNSGASTYFMGVLVRGA